MLRQFSPAQHQIWDQALSAGTSIPASTAGGDQVSGTIWPLLPNQAVRIYNVSLQTGVDASGSGAPNTVLLNANAIWIQLLDANENQIDYSLVLASGNYGSGNLINGSLTGAGLDANGDPMIELSSGFLRTNYASPGSPVFFQILGGVDVTNTDAVNAHVVSSTLVALLSFVQIR